MSEPSPNPILSLPDVHTAFAAFQDDPLVQAVTAYVKEYMKRYDASHSWDHVERVVAMAHHIYEHSPHELKNKADLRTVHLAALVHDVGDHKCVSFPMQQISFLFFSFLFFCTRPRE